MPRTTLLRYSMLALTAVTALSVAACGSSEKTASTSTSPSAAAASSATMSPSMSPSMSPPPSSSAPPSAVSPAKGSDRVIGQITSVSGTTIQVTRPDGPVTVEVSPSTKIMELTPGKLADITPGLCITIRPASGAEGGTVTADAVVFGNASDTQCHKTGGADNGGLPPSALGGFRGNVDSVSGNTIALTTYDENGTDINTTVLVNDATLYADRHPADAGALTEGKCIHARGVLDSAGTLQAETVNLPITRNGSCPQS